MGKVGAVSETCRQQGERQPDTSALHSHLWLIGRRTPGLQHAKIERNGVGGVETL